MQNSGNADNIKQPFTTVVDFEEVSLGSCSQGQNRGGFKLRQLLRIVEFKLPEAIA